MEKFSAAAKVGRHGTDRRQAPVRNVVVQSLGLSGTRCFAAFRVMAEGKELAANSLCVAVRVAAALRQVNCGRLDAELELSSMSRHDHYP